MKNVLVFALMLGILACGSPGIAASDQEGVSMAEPDWPQWRGLYRDGQIGRPKWPDGREQGFIQPGTYASALRPPRPATAKR